MKKLAFLVMPLWQGSSSSRAMQLIDGANALREDLPAHARHEIAVPLEAGDALGTPVARLSSVLRARNAARDVLAGLGDGHVGITVGGDGSSVIPGLEAAIERHGPDRLTVLWFGAHADLQHPSTSPTGAAATMSLRHALGDGSEDLRFATPLEDRSVSLIGSRELDDDEAAEVSRRGIDRIEHHGSSADALAERIRKTLSGRDATHVYIHIDLDVLDPAEFGAVGSPVPFGLSVTQLTETVRTAVGLAPLAGAAISGFQPQTPSDASEHLPTVLRVLGALSSGNSLERGDAR